MTEILLLGTFHFKEHDIAYYSDSIQAQIRKWLKKYYR